MFCKQPQVCQRSCVVLAATCSAWIWSTKPSSATVLGWKSAPAKWLMLTLHPLHTPVAWWREASRPPRKRPVFKTLKCRTYKQASQKKIAVCFVAMRLLVNWNGKITTDKWNIQHYSTEFLQTHSRVPTAPLRLPDGMLRSTPVNKRTPWWR